MIKEECKYYQDGMCCYEGCVSSICENNTECIYKQIVALQEENTLLKDELLRKSEQEQSFQSILDELKELKAYDNARQELLREFKDALIDIREIANKFDYWSNNLTDASNVLNEIKDKIEEVLNDK